MEKQSYSENNFNLSQELGLILVERKLTLAVAESCTGGGLAYQLTAIPGCSSWFERGLVVYSNTAKMELLAVKPATLERFGAVSEEVALAMVVGLLMRSPADIALSITGIAGPGGGTLEKPVGTVWFGLMMRNHVAQAKRCLLAGKRQQVRESAIDFALHWLLQNLG